MYGLILMDFSMPNMDGPTCVSKVREMLAQASENNRPRICCVTAYKAEAFKKRALGVGMDEFITKPIFKNVMQE